MSIVFFGEIFFSIFKKEINRTLFKLQHVEELKTTLQFGPPNLGLYSIFLKHVLNRPNFTLDNQIVFTSWFNEELLKLNKHTSQKW